MSTVNPCLPTGKHGYLLVVTVAFADLGRRGQIRRLRASAGRVLADYGMDGAALRLVNHDFNATYRVDHERGRFALRINTNSPRGVEQVRAEATWVEALADDTDLLVPRPVRTTAGDLAADAVIEGLEGERGAVLYHWLDGPDLGERASLRRLREVGRATAVLHEHTRRWALPDPEVRPGMASVFMDEPDFIDGDPRIGDADRVVLTAALAEMERVLAPVFAAAPQLIHGDLHVWNTKWVDGRLAILDFDDCGFGVPLQDLAITAYYLRDRAGAEEAVLTGYEDVSPLPAHTAAQFEALVAGRNLLLLNSLMPHVTAGTDDFLPGYVERTVRRLRGWLDTGRFEL